MQNKDSTSDHPFTVSFQKKIRNLNKKLRDIEALQNQETKTENQLEKISQKKTLKAQVAQMEKDMNAFL